MNEKVFVTINGKDHELVLTVKAFKEIQTLARETGADSGKLPFEDYYYYVCGVIVILINQGIARNNYEHLADETPITLDYLELFVTPNDIEQLENASNKATKIYATRFMQTVEELNPQAENGAKKKK